jgi:hypothetical protein
MSENQMRTRHLAIPALITLLSCLTSGCVTHTTVKDEPRQSVRFSTAQAAQTFYDAYLSSASPKGQGSVSVSVPLPYWHQTVSTDNVLFNTAVRSADSNHDGIISEEEARAFAAQRRTRDLALSSSPT